MQKTKKIGFAEYILIAYATAFVFLPFIPMLDLNIRFGFESVIKTFPTNYLLYITPPAFYFFFRKNSTINEKEKLFYLTAVCATVTALMYKGLDSNITSLTYTFAAIVLLSAIFINLNEFTNMAVLLSGLMIFKSATSFIFAAYIPVLLLLFVKYSIRKNSGDDKKISGYVLFGYLYIIVLAAILVFSGRATFEFPSAGYFSKKLADIFIYILGVALVAAACAMTVFRTIPVIRNNSILQKTAIITSSVYPFLLTATGFFSNIISTGIKNTILLSLIICIAENIQLSIICKDSAKPLIPEKLSNPVCGTVAAILFLFFCA